MSRAPQRFKQTELQRAIRAVQKEGGGMAVEITLDHRTIRLVPISSETSSADTSGKRQIVL